MGLLLMKKPLMFSVLHCGLLSLKSLLLVYVIDDLLKKLTGSTSSKLFSILNVSMRSALSCLVFSVVSPVALSYSCPGMGDDSVLELLLLHFLQ